MNRETDSLTPKTLQTKSIKRRQNENIYHNQDNNFKLSKFSFHRIFHRNSQTHRSKRIALTQGSPDTVQKGYQCERMAGQNDQRLSKTVVDIPFVNNGEEDSELRTKISDILQEASGRL
jgi:hypothetical protein